MPRWPGSITVSVNSDGVFEVPSEVVEQVPVQVERVDEVELEHVDEIDPHQLVALDLDRRVHVRERDRVGRVHLVRAVEVGVEPVHHHHELVGVLAAVGGVDERAVQALGDVVGQRAHVAVVEVQAGRQRVELVDGPVAGRDLAGAEATPSISAGWMPWKWIVCGCCEPLMNVIRSRSPSRQRSVGPGTRWL